MKFRVVHQPTTNPARSPFRFVGQTASREVDWVNRCLDYECLRCVADLTLRSYAQHLLHFLIRAYGRCRRVIDMIDGIVAGIAAPAEGNDFSAAEAEREILRPFQSGGVRNRAVNIAGDLQWQNLRDLRHGHVLAAHKTGS